MPEENPSFSDLLRLELRCPICREATASNHAECGHVFCSSCVQKIKDLGTQKATNPKCPICDHALKVQSIDQENDFEGIVERVGGISEWNLPCVTCEAEDPAHFCNSGCGFLCEACANSHMPEHQITEAFSVDSSSIILPAKCLTHSLSAVAVCLDCWLITELCEKCIEIEKRNPSHRHVKITELTLSNINYGEMISTLSQKHEAIENAKEKIDSELTKVIGQLYEVKECIRGQYKSLGNDGVDRANDEIKNLEERTERGCKPYYTQAQELEMQLAISCHMIDLLRLSEIVSTAVDIRARAQKYQKITNFLCKWKTYPIHEIKINMEVEKERKMEIIPESHLSNLKKLIASSVSVAILAIAIGLMLYFVLSEELVQSDAKIDELQEVIERLRQELSDEKTKLAECEGSLSGLGPSSRPTIFELFLIVVVGCLAVLCFRLNNALQRSPRKRN